MRDAADGDDSFPAFTLTCRGYRSGALSFAIADGVVAELNDGDLASSWHSAARLSPAKSERIAASARTRLAEVLSGGLGAADLPEAIADAAVVVLLAMKRHGIADPKRIPPCSVMWNGQERRERVHMDA